MDMWEGRARSCVLAGSRVVLMLWVPLGLDPPRTGCISCPHKAGVLEMDLWRAPKARQKAHTALCIYMRTLR